MSQKSMLDIAYDYAKQFDEPVPFKDIWEVVVNELGLSEEEAKAKVSMFYTNLSLDSRFHSTTDNKWILRSKLSFDDATADIFLVKEDLDGDTDEDYEEDEEEEEEESEDEEEIESEDDDDTLNSNMYNAENDEEE